MITQAWGSMARRRLKISRPLRSSI
jgi:hypothetical protein